MFVLLGALLGAISGSTLAYRRKGTKADILQYGFIYMMIFAIIGLFLTLIIHRATI